MKLRRGGDSRELDIEILACDDQRVRALVDGREIEATIESAPDGSVLIEVGGRRFRAAAARTRTGAIVAIGPRSIEFTAVEEGGRHHGRGLAAPEITAPMPGKVLKVMVHEGDVVEAGQPLVAIEAMKMETTLAAESPAIVRRIRVAAGQMVDHGAVLIELSPAADSSPREFEPPAS